VRSLQNIRETEEEIDSWFQVQSAVDPQPVVKQQKTPLLAQTAGKGDNITDEWKLAMARTSRRKRLPLKPEVPLQNCFATL